MRPLTVTLRPHSQWCVYTHSINGKVLYVGKGVASRPFSFIDRNDQWRKAVGSADQFQVTILGWYDDNDKALDRELDEIRRLKPIANLKSKNGPGARARARKLNAKNEVVVELVSKQRHMSDTEYAALLGISASYWCLIRKGRRQLRNPNAKMLKFLGMRQGYVKNGNGHRNGHRNGRGS